MSSSIYSTSSTILDVLHASLVLNVFLQGVSDIKEIFF